MRKSTMTMIAAMDVENDRLIAENVKLRAALEPFARNVQCLSLRGALGHITREDLLCARDALDAKV